MKVLIVYDSMYGNTEKIARAIGEAITGDVKLLRARDANPAELEPPDLLIIGSPTQGGRMTPVIQAFMDKIPEAAVKGVNVAAFDTRIPAKWVSIFGYAAGKIAGSLKAKGANIISPPEGFFVKGKEGPIKEGELERAAAWAKEVAKSKK